MSGWERDSLQNIPSIEIKRRIELAEAIINDGIKESVGATRLKEVIRQKDVLVRVLKDRERKRKPVHKKPDDIIISLKPLNLRVIRT